ncbi:MAG: hypothetical protein K5657_07860 [Desulfovibrio sp.]|nr:hypothetical protein [Desulfovibrio sp.]
MKILCPLLLLLLLFPPLFHVGKPSRDTGREAGVRPYLLALRLLRDHGRAAAPYCSGRDIFMGDLLSGPRGYDPCTDMLFRELGGLERAFFEGRFFPYAEEGKNTWEEAGDVTLRISGEESLIFGYGKEEGIKRAFSRLLPYALSRHEIRFHPNPGGVAIVIRHP